MRHGLVYAATFALVQALAPAHGASVDCPDAGVFSGKLFTDIPWSAIFPIRIAGLPIGGGSRPEGSSDQVLCLCDDALGVPHPGLVVGMWQPARLIELTEAPGCLPALGGVKLPVGQLRLRGTHGQQGYDNSDAFFLNYHYYAFPLLILLDLFFEDRCNADGYVDFDALALSELDPTWSSAELALLAVPEVALFAQPLAQAACVADCAKASAGDPVDSLYWCAGCWGRLYPPTGISGSYGGVPQHTSLYAARAVSMLHRRGQAWRTMGDGALCRAALYPTIPKSQYKLSMLYPVAEANDTHVIGETVYRWGMGRHYPGALAHVYVLWRWIDCCNTF